MNSPRTDAPVKRPDAPLAAASFTHRISTRYKVAVLATLAALLTGGAWIWAQGPTPSVGPVSVTPAYVVINTPTPVLFTAAIPGGSVATNGVKVVQLDSRGKMGKALGVMHDDGTNGDATAGDRIYTLRATLNRPHVSQESYRVVASFNGVSQLAQSSVVMVHLDPFPLPADPGSAGKQTLEGIDSDVDGVRDDVQRYLAHRFYGTPEIAMAATQAARAYQDWLLIDSTAADSQLRAMVAAEDLSIDCLQAISGDAANALQLLREIRGVVLNTKARSLAFVNADARLSGMFFPPSDPTTYRASCTF